MNWRMNPLVEHLEKQIHQLGSRARVTFRENVRAQEHHCAHFTLWQKRTYSRRVASHEIDLKLREAVRRNCDLGKLPEAGRHSIDDLNPLDNVSNDLLSGEHPVPRRLRECDSIEVTRYCVNRVDREIPAVELD
jgi:hypothetical protein